MGDCRRILAVLGTGLAMAACGGTAYQASTARPPSATRTTSPTPVATPATPQAVASTPAPSHTVAASPPAISSQPLPRYGNPDGHVYVPVAARAVSTAHPDHVIGHGTPASCTSAAVVQAVATGGIITFNCGPKPVTITMRATAKIVHGQRIVIDGGGKVTLSGGGKIRILYMNTCHNCWEQPGPLLIVQNMRFADGYSGAHQTSTSADYGGGSIFEQGGQLKVVNSAFVGSRCYQYGPDLGGGAIRAYGMDMSTPVYLTNDTFRGNTCANGGAVSGLYANFVVINSLLTGNQAVGWVRTPRSPARQAAGAAAPSIPTATATT